MLRALVAALFRCSHREITFPMTPRRTPGTKGLRTKPYVACLDCGQEFEYDWQEMKVRKAVKVTIPRHIQETLHEPHSRKQNCF